MSAFYRGLCKVLLPPTLAVSELMCLLGIWRRLDCVEEQLWIGCLPKRRDVERLHARGVLVLNMCGEHHGWGAEFMQRGIAHLHLRAIDYRCPDVAMLERGVAFIREHVAAGETVYVHCKAGRTRAAVVLCYLIAERNLKPRDAFAQLQRARRQVTSNLWRRKQIQEFAKNHA